MSPGTVGARRARKQKHGCAVRAFRIQRRLLLSPNPTTQVSDRPRPRTPVRSPQARSHAHPAARARSRAQPLPKRPEPRVRAPHGEIGAACSDPVTAGTGGSSRVSRWSPKARSSAWSASALRATNTAAAAAAARLARACGEESGATAFCNPPSLRSNEA